MAALISCGKRRGPKLRRPLIARPIFATLIDLYGFSRTEVGDQPVFFREIDQHGRHLLIENLLPGPRFRGFPMTLSEYQGPYVRAHLIHREVAYISDDLFAFLREWLPGALYGTNPH